MARRKPGFQRHSGQAVRFSSAEDAAEGPSEDEPEPSAMDLAASAVTIGDPGG